MPVVKPSQRTKLNRKSPGIPTRIAEPTGKAGLKNSNGPKGGSGKNKVTVPNNSRNKSPSKVSSRPKKNNPNQIVRSGGGGPPNNAGLMSRLRSKRINYRQLKG